MQHSVGQWAPRRDAPRWSHPPANGPSPANVPGATVLPRRQPDQPTQALGAPLELKVRQPDVVVALLAIDECPVGGLPFRSGQLRLHGPHPRRSIRPLAETLPPRGLVPGGGEPLLKHPRSGRRPQPVDHGKQADGPLGHRPVVPFLRKERNHGPAVAPRPDSLRLHPCQDRGELPEGLHGQQSELPHGPAIESTGLADVDVGHDSVEELPGERWHPRQFVEGKPGGLLRLFPRVQQGRPAVRRVANDAGGIH